MHLLFPERFAEGDENGDEAWDCDWFIDNTGSKWPPEVCVCVSGVPGVTVLDYESAWTPNNGTLQRWHDKTGWTIRNDYYEGGAQFAGCLICEDGRITDEEQEYLTVCEVCEMPCIENEFDDELEGLICNACRSGSAKPIS